MNETRKLAAIMFTDIVGYSALMSKDEKQAMNILVKNRKIHKAAITQFNGEFIKEIGDGTLSIFNSSFDAVCCAIEIQKACYKESSFKIRIGIHIGDIIISGGDVFGDGVNIAARIEAAGKPGGIYFSERVYDDIRNKTEIQVEFFDEKMLKNIPKSIKIYVIKADPEIPKSQQKSNRLNWIIIATLCLAVVLLLYNNFLSKTEKPPVFNEIVDTSQISLAVLAFEDMSPDKDQEYLSDGMSTELTALLSKMPDLNVRDRRSSFSFKGKNATMKTIANELKVTHVIDGSVRKINDYVRIDIQLIDVSDGTNIWSQTFTRKLENIFQMQDDIASKVREQLKLKLFNENIESSEVNSEAYSLYLQADFLYYKNNAETNLDAIELLTNSIEIDSTYAPAFTLLGRALVASTINHQKIPIEQGLNGARQALEKAILLDNNSAQAYAQLARVDLSQNLDFESANYNINKALQINPNDGFVLANAVIIQGYSGNLDNVVEDHTKLLEISPKEYRYYRNKGIAQYWVGDLDGALKSFEKYNYFYPSAPVGHFMIAKIYFEKGDYQKALEMAEKETITFMSYSAQCFALFGLGRLKESEIFFEKFINVNDEIAKSNIAELYAFLGDKENVIKNLNLAYNLSDPDLIELINFPIFRLVYDDPRWESLLHKMNLPKNHHLFKKIITRK